MNDNQQNTEPGVARKRILIVDDHPLYRDGLVRFIGGQVDLECCGEVDNRLALPGAVARFSPDLVLLDLRLRGEDMVDSIKDLTIQNPGLRILVLSQKDESFYAEPCLRAGARGYIMKEEATQELLNAIHCVLAGELYVSRRMTGIILKRFMSGKVGDGFVSKLSDREFQVFQFLGGGMTTHEIATQLNLSVKTVETHRENIKNKLSYRDSASLVEAAKEWVRASER